MCRYFLSCFLLLVYVAVNNSHYIFAHIHYLLMKHRYIYTGIQILLGT